MASSWWNRRLGWLKSEDSAEAAAAAARAAAALREVRQRGPEVRRISEEARSRRDRNGFTEMLTEAMHLKEDT